MGLGLQLALILPHLTSLVGSSGAAIQLTPTPALTSTTLTTTLTFSCISGQIIIIGHIEVGERLQHLVVRIG